MAKEPIIYSCLTDAHPAGHRKIRFFVDLRDACRDYKPPACAHNRVAYVSANACRRADVGSYISASCHCSLRNDNARYSLYKHDLEPEEYNAETMLWLIRDSG